MQAERRQERDRCVANTRPEHRVHTNATAYEVFTELEERKEAERCRYESNKRRHFVAPQRVGHENNLNNKGGNHDGRRKAKKGRTPATSAQ